MGVTIGLDIGGTKLMVAAGNAAGAQFRTRRAPTPLGLQAGLTLLDSMITEVLEGETPDAIGIAVGGPLNHLTGVVSPLHQPEWRDVPLAKRMEHRWNCPVAVDVDTNVAAVGEYVAGDYKCARFLYLTLSTGMGGGFLVDGKVYRGSAGMHPEVAHQTIPFRSPHPERVACPCGAFGCLEAVVSGTGIQRVYGVPAHALPEADWDDVAWNLGQGLRNIATIYMPDVIVIGGGIAYGRGERLLGPARRVMEQNLRVVRPPEVRLSVLGYDTALVGSLIAAGRLGREVDLVTSKPHHLNARYANGPRLAEQVG